MLKADATEKLDLLSGAKTPKSKVRQAPLRQSTGTVGATTSLSRPDILLNPNVQASKEQVIHWGRSTSLPKGQGTIRASLTPDVPVRAF